MNDSSREQRLADYLLGRLPEEERAEIEDRLFTDDQLYEELQATSDDLIHAYLAQELSPEDLPRFEQHFLASPRRRERVAFMRDLVTAVRPVESAGVAPGSPRRTSFRRWSLAAGLFLAAAAAILILLLRPGQPGVPHAKATPTPPVDLGAPSPQASPEAGHTEPSPRTATPSPAPRSPRQAEVHVVRLPSAPDTQARELRLSDARVVRLEVSLPERRAPGYDVVLRTADGGEAWRVDGLVAMAGQPLVIDVPAETFTSGEYTLDVDGEPVRRAPPMEDPHRQYRLRVRRLP